jgi:FG-GAP-like repeat/Secretion system C-terminal sorting domain
MKILPFIISLFLSAILNAQNSPFQYRFETTIPVKDNGEFYSDAWSGGLNAVQYNTMDLNFDNADDLVLFDRTAQKVITLLRVGNAYQYAPHFERLFPDQLYNWMLIRDFNCDGRKDIFTGHIFGISVYQNISNDDAIRWEHFPFYDGNSESEVILTEGLSGRVNLQIQFDDLPSISDADGDGDLDIFVMNYGGSGMIQYHKNMSQENALGCDSLDFRLADPWWGGIRECECDQFAYENEECDSGGRIDHAGGKSLMLMDGDGDGFQDLLISEGECGVLNMLNNDGPVDAPLIQGAPHFPLGIAEEFNLYPTGYFEDVDFDGNRDFMMSTNVFSRSSYDIDFRQSNWFYKNTGTNESPTFALQTKSFLQSEMIDAGDNAVVAFYDLDSDSDYDMFISNNDLPSTIRLYKNNGTPFEPQFELTDHDYLDLSAHNFTQLKIQFADINDDGKIDLAFTATDNDESFTDVFYIPNKKSGGLDFAGETVTRLNFLVARGENVSFIQVDNDGRVDILKGKSNGAVEFWKNTGSQFVLENTEYLEMGPNVTATRRAFASADLDVDGKADLIIGDESGTIQILPDFRNAQNLDGLLSEIILDEGTQEYYASNLGGRIWPAVVDLHGSGKPVIVAGSILGGVRLLRAVNDESPVPIIGMYPNPVAPTLEKLTVTSNKSAVMEILSVKGDQLRPPMDIPEKQIVELALQDFAAGVYLVKFTVENKTIVRRLVVY